MRFWVGIDDTDMLGTPGTNQLARKMVEAIEGRCRCLRILRHQLCSDPRIPCTSKNGSASIALEWLGAFDASWLKLTLKETMQAHFVEGSDPGLSIAIQIPLAVQDFGLRAKREIVEVESAYRLATENGIFLEGLGGTGGGVIGALAAVGLAATDDDGRAIRWEVGELDISGAVEIHWLQQSGVSVVNVDGSPVVDGIVDVGKRLRPNCRQGKMVLTVAKNADRAGGWKALKLP